MGNALTTPCFPPSQPVTPVPVPHDDQGYAFALSASQFPEDRNPSAAFYSISGASLSANPATPLSTDFANCNDLACLSSASFESTPSFASIAFQPSRYSGSFSGPLSSFSNGFSGPLSDREWHSGPIDGSSSGRLDRRQSLSGSSSVIQLSRTLSQLAAERRMNRRNRRRPAFVRRFAKALSKLKLVGKSSKKASKDNNGENKGFGSSGNSEELNSVEGQQNGNVHWAQGKAGEDRVHVVVSEEHGWLFVGIYDGFSGPDATDFLLNNLYDSVHKMLKGILWDDEQSSSEKRRETTSLNNENWDTENQELGRRFREQIRRPSSSTTNAALDRKVLRALSRALQKTEEAYLEFAEQKVSVNPELALMGSCVLVMLMKGDDLYLMNVGDSRAVLARRTEHDLSMLVGKATQDMDPIMNETRRYLEECPDGDIVAVQLTQDHSTSVHEEVNMIRSKHPDDPSAVINNRVKGKLKVTRAFGAGYLKQPKFNDALLESFKVDYKGNKPYITCNPYLYHHRLGPKDKYLVLSSDGLYQYLTNEEVVNEVEKHTSLAHGDPAQFLVDEVLFRTAKEAGLEFDQLMEIPQGDRRKYHDDVSIIVISLEGQIWKSNM